jgi:hypothetical protein
MSTARCKVCQAKDETIVALRATVQALTELTNTQRELMVPNGFVGEAAPLHPPPLELAEPYEEPVDIDEIRARLNAGVDDPSVSERLMAELQATGALREKE